MSDAPPLIYLSEMSVSNAHGGGLTLQRILGEDLKRVSRFVALEPAAVHKFPFIESCRQRVLDLSEVKNRRRKEVPLPHRGWNALAWRLAGYRRADHHLGKRLATEYTRELSARMDAENSSWLVVPQGTASVYMMEQIRHDYGGKYLTWIMDDHVVKFHGDRFRYPTGYHQVFGDHLRHAEKVFVISPAMGEFYRKEFGVDSEVLFGPTDPSEGQTLRWTVTEADRPLRLGYFGAVTAWQRDAMDRVVDLLDEAGACLDIYSAKDRMPESMNRPMVRQMDPLSPGEVLRAMSGYDAVLLPMSFTPGQAGLTRLNIATKMSEYLASGTVVFAVGPAEGAMIRYLNEHGAAETVTSLEREDLLNGLSRLRDPAQRKLRLEQARALSLSKTGTRAMRDVWTSGLNLLQSAPSISI